MARKKSYADVSKVRRMLRRASPELTKNIKELVKDISDKILIEAKKRTPVDTGRLRDSISVKISRDGFASTVGFIGKRAQRKAFYAPFIEFGTKAYKAGDKRTTPNSKTTKVLKKSVSAKPARPFMRSAREVVAAQSAEELRKAVVKAIDIIERQS